MLQPPDSFPHKCASFTNNNDPVCGLNSYVEDELRFFCNGINGEPIPYVWDVYASHRLAFSPGPAHSVASAGMYALWCGKTSAS